MKFDVILFDVGKVGDIDLSDDIFGLEFCVDLLYCVVCWQCVCVQQGMYLVLGKLDVSYLIKKIYCQKGIGGVCYGFCKVLIFCYGGVYKGLILCLYVFDLLKKVCVFGLKYVLLVKYVVGELVIVDSLNIGEVKILVVVKVVKENGWKCVLVIDGVEVNENFVCVVCNLEGIDVLFFIGVNVYDILCCDMFVLMCVGVEVLEVCLK